MKLVKKVADFFKSIFGQDIRINIKNANKYNVKKNKNIGSININEGIKNEKK